MFIFQRHLKLSWDIGFLVFDLPSSSISHLSLPIRQFHATRTHDHQRFSCIPAAPCDDAPWKNAGLGATDFKGSGTVSWGAQLSSNRRHMDLNSNRPIAWNSRGRGAVAPRSSSNLLPNQDEAFCMSAANRPHSTQIQQIGRCHLAANHTGVPRNRTSQTVYCRFMDPMNDGKPWRLALANKKSTAHTEPTKSPHLQGSITRNGGERHKFSQ